MGGQVTLDGKPLLEGRISLKPTAGRAVSAEIAQGRYAFAEDAGLAAGEAYSVRITAVRETGRKYRSPDPPNHLVKETEQYIPAQYNTRSSLEETLALGENQADFKLLTK